MSKTSPPTEISGLSRTEISGLVVVVTSMMTLNLEDHGINSEENTRSLLSELIVPHDDRIRFNVGGKIFETTTTTLANAGRDTYFGALLDSNWNNLKRSNSNSDHDDDDHFIDRNPSCFAVLLDLLRTNTVSLPSSLPLSLLRRESAFYGLENRLRSAMWGPFDGNRLRFKDSVSGIAPGDGTVIRGGPEGGCCVAHGSTVHVYDWMMEERDAPINLDYQIINDVVWISSENVVVSSVMGRGEGGMGMFDVESGEMRHRFRVRHGNDEVKRFTGGALCCGKGRVFSSCKGRMNEYGIGVWDSGSGEQVEFFYEPEGWSLGDADRLQWLDGCNCLMVATTFPRKDNCYISVLDFRMKEMVWSWSDMGAPATVDWKRVRDAIVMEDTRSICVVNEFEDLGFIDMRSSGGGSSSGGVRWSSRCRSRLMNGNFPDGEPCYPKLAMHNGQLFFSMNDCISVFCGSDWVLTSRLRRSHGGPICDFSIGGDRLFALHSEENVFDVWETPPPRFGL